MDDKLLEAFDSLRVLQSVGQVRKILNDHGVSWDEFDEWLKTKLKAPVPKLPNTDDTTGQEKDHGKRFLKCPQCGKKLNLSAVAERSIKYRQGYRTYILCGAACCPGKGCGYSRFSKATVNELIKKGSIE